MGKDKKELESGERNTFSPLLTRFPLSSFGSMEDNFTLSYAQLGGLQSLFTQAEAAQAQAQAQAQVQVQADSSSSGAQARLGPSDLGVGALSAASASASASAGPSRKVSEELDPLHRTGTVAARA